jgi:DNA-directed RNA polymerase subunit L
MIQNLLKEYTTEALRHFANAELAPLIPSRDENDEIMEVDGTTIMEVKELSPGEAQHAVNQVAEWLAQIPGDLMRDNYADLIFRQHKKLIGKKTNITKAMKAKIEVANNSKMNGSTIHNREELGTRIPDGVNVMEAMQRGGWYQVEDDREHPTGIYFIKNMSQDPVKVSNFTVEPLFHKVDRDDNSRVIKLFSDHDGEQILELPSSALLSRDSFRKFLFDKGAYFFEGTGMELDKITGSIMPRFPKAWELKELGWQPEGFFAFYNYSFNGTLSEYDNAGLVKHGDRWFYSPAVSQAFNDERQGNDQFENDRFLSYYEPPIQFEKWVQLVHGVYPAHSEAIIGGALLSLHRDVHFKIDNNCPHLYFYGETGSGKSKAAESLSNLFFKELPAFALSSGTDFAFAKRLGRYRNTPVIMNEFDITMIKPERFNQLKNAYDGEGREKGTGMSKSKTTTEKVESMLILVGQYLITDDDNSMVNRSIVQKFTKVKIRDEAKLKQYEELKQFEKMGLGGVICELLPHRKEVEKSYYKIFHEVMSTIAQRIRKKDRQYQERILRNYSAIPAMCKVFSSHFNFPWSDEHLMDWAEKEITQLSNMISKSDILMKFWAVLESLVLEGSMRYGRHYATDELATLTLIDESTPKILGEPRKLLVLRLHMAHQIYMKQCRSTGERPIDITSLENYLKDKEYCMGRKQHRFTEIGQMDGHGGRRSKSTSAKAWVIDLEMAGLGDSAFSMEREYIQGGMQNDGDDGSKKEDGDGIGEPIGNDKSPF